MHAPSTGEILEQLSGLLGRTHVSEDYVSFRSELLKAQAQVRDAATDSDEPRADQTPQRGKLDPATVPMDTALLATLLRSIRAASGGQHQQETNLDQLLQAARQEPPLLEQLARRTACGPDKDYLEELAGRVEIPVGVLVFVGRILAAPFVARHISAADTQGDGTSGMTRSESGHCPACGSPPGLALLRGEEGRRVLCCSLCGQRWAFARLACPHCGNENQRSLVTLTLEEHEARWIEACETCKGYVKTLDERKLPVGQAVIPLVEEAATLHLDLVAEEEGYRPKLPYAALT